MNPHPLAWKSGKKQVPYSEHIKMRDERRRLKREQRNLVKFFTEIFSGRVTT